MEDITPDSLGETLPSGEHDARFRPYTPLSLVETPEGSLDIGNWGLWNTQQDNSGYEDLERKQIEFDNLRAFGQFGGGEWKDVYANADPNFVGPQLPVGRTNTSMGTSIGIDETQDGYFTDMTFGNFWRATVKNQLWPTQFFIDNEELNEAFPTDYQSLETAGEQGLNYQMSTLGTRGIFDQANPDADKLLLLRAASDPNAYSFDVTKAYDWADDNLGGSIKTWFTGLAQSFWAYDGVTQQSMMVKELKHKINTMDPNWNPAVAAQATADYRRENPDLDLFLQSSGVSLDKHTRLTKNSVGFVLAINNAIVEANQNRRLEIYEKKTGFIGSFADKLYYGVKDPTVARDLIATTILSAGMATAEVTAAKVATMGMTRALGAGELLKSTARGIAKYGTRGISGGPMTGPLESAVYNSLKFAIPSVGHNGLATTAARATAIMAESTLYSSVAAYHAQASEFEFQSLLYNKGENAPEFQTDWNNIRETALAGGAVGLVFFGGMRIGLGGLGDIAAYRAAPQGAKWKAVGSNFANTLDSYSKTPEGLTIFGNKLGGNRGVLFGNWLDKVMVGIDNRNTAGVIVNGKQLYHYTGVTKTVAAKANYNEDKANQVAVLFRDIHNTAETPVHLLDPDALASRGLTYDDVISTLEAIKEGKRVGLEARAVRPLKWWEQNLLYDKDLTDQKSARLGKIADLDKDDLKLSEEAESRATAMGKLDSEEAEIIARNQTKASTENDEVDEAIKKLSTYKKLTIKQAEQLKALEARRAVLDESSLKVSDADQKRLGKIGAKRSALLELNYRLGEVSAVKREANRLNRDALKAQDPERDTNATIAARVEEAETQIKDLEDTLIDLRTVESDQIAARNVRLSALWKEMWELEAKETTDGSLNVSDTARRTALVQEDVDLRDTTIKLAAEADELQATLRHNYAVDAQLLSLRESVAALGVPLQRADDIETARLKELTTRLETETDPVKIGVAKLEIERLMDTRLFETPETIRAAQSLEIVSAHMHLRPGYDSSNMMIVTELSLKLQSLLGRAALAGLDVPTLKTKFKEVMGVDLDYGNLRHTLVDLPFMAEHMADGLRLTAIKTFLDGVNELADGGVSPAGVKIHGDKIYQPLVAALKLLDRRPPTTKPFVVFVTSLGLWTTGHGKTSPHALTKITLDADGKISVSTEVSTIGKNADDVLETTTPSKHTLDPDYTDQNIVDINTLHSTIKLWDEAVTKLVTDADNEKAALIGTTITELADVGKAAVLRGEALVATQLPIIKAKLAGLLEPVAFQEFTNFYKEVKARIGKVSFEDDVANRILLENVGKLLEIEIAKMVDTDPNFLKWKKLEAQYKHEDLSLSKAIAPPAAKASKVVPSDAPNNILLKTDLGERLNPTPDHLRFVLGFTEEEALVGSIVMKALGMDLNKVGVANVKVAKVVNATATDQENGRIWLNRTREGVKALIGANKGADLFTVTHEMSHYARYLFLDPNASGAERAAVGITTGMYDNLMKWLGATTDAKGKYVLTADQEEQFANGFAHYIRQLMLGRAKDTNMGVHFLFNKLGEHISSLGESWKTGDAAFKVTPEAEEVYGALLAFTSRDNITEMFHDGFAGLMKTMTQAEQDLLGQKILGEMQYSNYKALIERDAEVYGRTSSAIISGVGAKDRLPINNVRAAAAGLAKAKDDLAVLTKATKEADAARKAGIALAEKEAKAAIKAANKAAKAESDLLLKVEDDRVTADLAAKKLLDDATKLANKRLKATEKLIDDAAKAQVKLLEKAERDLAIAKTTDEKAAAKALRDKLREDTAAKDVEMQNLLTELREEISTREATANALLASTTKTEDSVLVPAKEATIATAAAASVATTKVRALKKVHTDAVAVESTAHVDLVSKVAEGEVAETRLAVKEAVTAVVAEDIAKTVDSLATGNDLNLLRWPQLEEFYNKQARDIAAGRTPEKIIDIKIDGSRGEITIESTTPYDPTPGTSIAIKRYGYGVNEQRMISATASGRKPLTLIPNRLREEAAKAGLVEYLISDRLGPQSFWGLPNVSEKFLSELRELYSKPAPTDYDGLLAQNITLGKIFGFTEKEIADFVEGKTQYDKLPETAHLSEEDLAVRTTRTEVFEVTEQVDSFSEIAKAVTDAQRKVSETVPGVFIPEYVPEPAAVKNALRVIDIENKKQIKKAETIEWENRERDVYIAATPERQAANIVKYNELVNSKEWSDILEKSKANNVDIDSVVSKEITDWKNSRIPSNDFYPFSTYGLNLVKNMEVAESLGMTFMQYYAYVEGKLAIEALSTPPKPQEISKAIRKVPSAVIASNFGKPIPDHVPAPLVDASKTVTEIAKQVSTAKAADAMASTPETRTALATASAKMSSVAEVISETQAKHMAAFDTLVNSKEWDAAITKNEAAGHHMDVDEMAQIAIDQFKGLNQNGRYKEWREILAPTPTNKNPTRDYIAVANRIGITEEQLYVYIEGKMALQDTQTKHVIKLLEKKIASADKTIASGGRVKEDVLLEIEQVRDVEQAFDSKVVGISDDRKRLVSALTAAYGELLGTVVIKGKHGWESGDQVGELFLAMLTRDGIIESLKKAGVSFENIPLLEAQLKLVGGAKSDPMFKALKNIMWSLGREGNRIGTRQITVDEIDPTTGAVVQVTKRVRIESNVASAKGSETEITLDDVKPMSGRNVDRSMTVESGENAKEARELSKFLFKYLSDHEDKELAQFFLAKKQVLEDGSVKQTKSAIKVLFDAQGIMNKKGEPYTGQQIRDLEAKVVAVAKAWLEEMRLTNPVVVARLEDLVPEYRTIKEGIVKGDLLDEASFPQIRQEVEAYMAFPTQSTWVVTPEYVNNVPGAKKVKRAVITNLGKFLVHLRDTPELSSYKNVLDAFLNTRSPEINHILNTLPVEFYAGRIDHNFYTFSNSVMGLGDGADITTILHEVIHVITGQRIEKQISKHMDAPTKAFYDLTKRDQFAVIKEVGNNPKLDPEVRNIAKAYVDYVEKDMFLYSLMFQDRMDSAVLAAGSNYRGMSYGVQENGDVHFETATLRTDVTVERFAPKDFGLGTLKPRVYVVPPQFTMNGLGKRMGEDGTGVIRAKDFEETFKIFETTLGKMGLQRGRDYGIIYHVNVHGDIQLFFQLAKAPDGDFIVPKKFWENSGSVLNRTGNYSQRTLPQSGFSYAKSDIHEFIANTISDIAHAKELSKTPSTHGAIPENPLSSAVYDLFPTLRNSSGAESSILDIVFGSISTINRRSDTVDDFSVGDYASTTWPQRAARKPREPRKAVGTSGDKLIEFRNTLSTDKGRWLAAAAKLQKAINDGASLTDIQGIKNDMAVLLAKVSASRKTLLALGVSETFNKEDMAAVSKLLQGLGAADDISKQVGEANAKSMMTNAMLNHPDMETRAVLSKVFKSSKNPLSRLFTSKLNENPILDVELARASDEMGKKDILDGDEEDGEEGANKPTTFRELPEDERRAFIVNTMIPSIEGAMGDKAGPQNILSKFFYGVPGGQTLAKLFQNAVGAGVSYGDTVNTKYKLLAFVAKLMDPNIDVRNGEIAGNFKLFSLEESEAHAMSVLTSSGIPEIRTKLLQARLSEAKLGEINELAWSYLHRPMDLPEGVPNRELIEGLIEARINYNKGVSKILESGSPRSVNLDPTTFGTSHRPSKYAKDNPAEFVKALTAHELAKARASTTLHAATMYALGWIEIRRNLDDGGVDRVVVKADSPIAKYFDKDQIGEVLSWRVAEKQLSEVHLKGPDKGKPKGDLMSPEHRAMYDEALGQVTEHYTQAWRDYYKNFENPTAIFVAMRTAKDRILKIEGGESDNKSLAPKTFFANKASDYTEERLFTHEELVNDPELSKFYSKNILGLSVDEANTRLFQHVVNERLKNMFGLHMTMDDLLNLIKSVEKNYSRDMDASSQAERASFNRGFDKLQRSWLQKTGRVSTEVSDYDKNYRWVLDNSHDFILTLGGVSAGLKTLVSEIPRALLTSDRNKAMITQFVPNLYRALKYGLPGGGERRLALLRSASSIHWARAVLQDAYSTNYEHVGSLLDNRGPIMGRSGAWSNLKNRWNSLAEDVKEAEGLGDKATSVVKAVGWLGGGILRYGNEIVHVISMHNILRNLTDNVDNYVKLADLLEKERENLDGNVMVRTQFNKLAKSCGLSPDEALDMSRSGLLDPTKIGILRRAFKDNEAAVTTEGLPDSGKLLRWAELQDDATLAREAVVSMAGYIKTLLRNTNTEPTLLDTRVSVDPTVRMLRLFTQYNTSNSVQGIGRVKRAGGKELAKFLAGQLLMQMAGGLVISYLLNLGDAEETENQITDTPVAFVLSNLARMPNYGGYGWLFKLLLAGGYEAYAEMSDTEAPEVIGKAMVPELVSSPMQYRMDSLGKDSAKMPGIMFRYFQGETMTTKERNLAIEHLPLMENYMMSGLIKAVLSPDTGMSPDMSSGGQSSGKRYQTTTPSRPQAPMGPGPQVPAVTTPVVKSRVNPMQPITGKKIEGVSKDLADLLQN